MNYPGITLTGVDERTSIEDAIRLADLGAEIGVLYTFSPDGRNRYPSLHWIIGAAKALKGRAAIHFCGARAHAQLINDDFKNLLCWVDRFQVNGVVSPAELIAICKIHPGHTVITQQSDRYGKGLVSVGVPNHAILMDNSGGRGKLPELWTRAITTDKPVGFAGGLGPSTIRKSLPKIAAIARGDWWIDMEGRLRDGDDWFSMERALQVMSWWRAWKCLGMPKAGAQ